MSATFRLSTQYEGGSALYMELPKPFRWTTYIGKKKLKDLTLADFDASLDWTPLELDHFASLMLKEDRKTTEEKFLPFLLDDQLDDRYNREIYNTTGTPDPAFGSGIYWRTHPQGRKFKLDPEERKKNGDSFYR